MPENPQDNVPSVLSTVQPDVRAPANLTPADFGAAIGEADDQAGAKFQREYVWANQAAVMAAKNKLDDHTNDTVYNAQTGILNQDKGTAAPAAVKDVLDSHAEKISDISSGLSNDAQRHMFAASAAEHMRGLDRTLNGWEARQVNDANQKTTEAYVRNTTQSAIQSALSPAPAIPGVPDPTKTRIAQIGAAITAQNTANGFAPDSEVTKLQVRNATSNVHTGIVDALLENNRLDAARSYYDQNKDAINQPESSRIASALKTQGTENDAQQIANRYLAGDNGQIATRSEFLTKVDNDPVLAKNAELYDRVLSRGERHFAVADQAKKADQEDILTRADNAIRNNGGTGDIGITPLEYAKLDAQQKRVIDSLQDQATRHQQPSPGGPTMYKLRQAAAADPDKFKATNLLDYWDQLAPSERKELSDLQATMKTGEQPDGKAQDALNRQKVGDYFLRSVGVNPKLDDNTTPQQNETVYQFRKEFDNLADDYLQGNPKTKSIPQDQLEDIGKKVLANMYITKTGFWGATREPNPAFPGNIEATRPNSPTVSPTDLQEWKRVMSNPTDPRYRNSLQILGRWKQGLTEDGRVDPALEQRYERIRAELSQ